ncbi:S-type pyocin domain-containing protein [Pseudomonas sp.]|uniref:S-type pyocin domain-containing protein n=1 Tax=Pseudomonas sp. TaxID=306 RepID=UPI003F3F8A0D
MQKPPTPGFLDISEPVHTIGQAPDHITPAPRTATTVITGPHGHGIPVYYQNLNTIKATSSALEQEYQTKSSQLPQTIENELATTRLEGPTDPLAPVQSIIRELDVRSRLTARKTAEFQNKTAVAHSFYGGDPFNRHINEFMNKATTIEKRPAPNGVAMQALFQSLRAAHDARLLAQGLELLRQQNVNVQNFLSAVQANEQAQKAAAELVRINEEAAARTREQARLAALENARRVAAEQARVATQAAAQQVAVERARLEAQAKAKWEAEWERFRKQREANSRELMEKHAEFVRQNEQARVEKQQAEREKTRLHALWSTQAYQASLTFANAGSTAASGPVFSGTNGTVDVSREASLALKAALRTAVAAVVEALATATAPTLMGFAALIVPSRLGNSDLYSVSIPLTELAPLPTANLYEQAVTGGEIDLPVTLGSKTYRNRVELFVVATDGVAVPNKVPVKLAHFDPQKNVYVSGSNVINGPVITWTPLVDPQNTSTDFPLTETDLPIYEGATVTPHTGRIDPFPAFDRYGFGGFITVFPIDSGLPPIFTLLRDRRQDSGMAIGAGQSVSGNWLGAAATLEGAPIPKQIADKLRGREFSSFDAFRREFWRTVAKDELLLDQFSFFNKIDIRRGLSPSALPSEQVGGRQKFEIHHIKPISEGGSVYDLDNLRVLTPKQHIRIHSKTGDK